MPLRHGIPAPDFTLTNAFGKAFTLSKDAKKQPVLVFFYPKDFTAVCTRQACSLRDSYGFFQDLGIKIIGLSRDGQESHKQFIAFNQLPFDMLSDPGLKVARQYGAVFPIINQPRRVSYLLDPEHKILTGYSNLLSAEGHLEHMVHFIKEHRLDERWAETVVAPQVKS